jgi:hypothetical protein
MSQHQLLLAKSVAKLPGKEGLTVMGLEEEVFLF